MTPEEWAQRVVGDLGREPFMHAALVKRLMSEVIAAAVAEEREACAEVADKWKSSAIATAIRVRPLTASPPRR